MFVLNNKSNYHEGSKLVWDTIVKFFQDTPNGKVIINGEGTLHNDTYRSRVLLDKAKTLNENGYKVYLINCVWQNNDFNNRYLKYFERIYVRESLSQAQIQEAGYKAEVVPDLSIYGEVEKKKVKINLIVIDSVKATVSKELEELAKKKKAPFFKMCERWDVEKAISQANQVYTGRFHGAILALKHNKPVKIFESNTHKMEGLKKDIGNDPVAYVKNAQKKIEKMFGDIKND